MTTGTGTQQQSSDDFTRRLLQIEQAAVRAVITAYLMELAHLRRQARARILTAGAESAARVIARDLAAAAGQAIDERTLLTAADRYARQAADLGTAWAQGIQPADPGPVASRAMQAAIATAEDKVRVAVKLLGTADTPVAVASALKVAEAAARNLATGAEYAVNASSNNAIRRTAALSGGLLLWRAEPDCCVVCAALAGQIADPHEGEAFDETATFDPTHPAPEVWPPGMPLIAPPRHPHCRCWLEVWYGARGPALTDFSLTLQREALRSIARGWSLPSESGAARSRAAAYILSSGLAERLPKSVRAEAVRGAAGHFTDRTFPAHRTNVR